MTTSSLLTLVLSSFTLCKIQVKRKKKLCYDILIFYTQPNNQKWWVYIESDIESLLNKEIIY